MKRILLTLGMVGFIISGYAQYYYIPYLNIGTNPGGLNTLDELPVGAGLDGSWTIVHEGSAAAPAWTPILNMPFLFHFNGQPAFQFKVSTTGVLTFETGTTILPPPQNTNLPSGFLPDKSVVVWGLNGTGFDDKIVMRVFEGTEGKQLWISYVNYGYINSLPICNHYWSIVMEENTNNIYIVDQKSSAISTCSPSLTLGIQFDAQHAIEVAGSPAVKSLAGIDPSSADNSYYEFVPGEQPKQDIRALSIDVSSSILLTDAPVAIKGTFLSIGANALRSFDLSYSIDGGQVHTQHFSGDFTSLELEHNKPWIPTALGDYEIKLWITNPNGETDAKPADNEMVKMVSVVEKSPPKQALIESFTQHNCGPCAAQNPALDALIQANFQKIATVKWVVTWPGANDDPRHHFNSAANQARRTYYSVNGVPNTILAGNVFNGAPGGVSLSMVNNEYNKPNLFNFDINESISGNNIDVSVDVTSLQDPGIANLTLQIAIIQDELHYPSPTGSNGEKDFYETMRYVIPSASGTSISTTPGTTTTVSGSRAIDPIFYKSFMRVITWIQNDNTKEVFAVGKSEGIYFCADGTTITPTPNITEASCAGNDGGISMNISGGSAPYNFAWSSGETTQIITGKAAGDYSVVITDANGCSFTKKTTIPEKPSPNVIVSPETTTCNGDTDGSINTYVAGGATPYTFSWNTGATSKDLSGLTPGVYVLTMTDADGCSLMQSALVEEPDMMSGNGTSDHPDNGTNNGAASVEITGGTYPYTYAWSHDASLNSATASDLASGSYDVTVTDYNGCQTTVNLVVDSNVGIEDLTKAGINNLTIFPNPTRGAFTLDIELAKIDDLSFSVYDVNGKVVFQKAQRGVSRFQEQINLNGIAVGIYTLKVATSQGVGYERIVIE